MPSENTCDKELIAATSPPGGKCLNHSGVILSLILNTGDKAFIIPAIAWTISLSPKLELMTAKLRTVPTEITKRKLMYTEALKNSPSCCFSAGPGIHV